MAPKLVAIPTTRERSAEQQLTVLYERRAMISALIQDLEDYDRFRARRLEPKELKTA